jgi:hypothetical protein
MPIRNHPSAPNPPPAPARSRPWPKLLLHSSFGQHRSRSGEDPDSITTTAVAKSGQITSPIASASTTVILDPATMNPLMPTASPDIVTNGKPTEIFFAVSPTFVPSGPVNLVDPSGKSQEELKDEDTNGDLEAGDGSFGCHGQPAWKSSSEPTPSSSTNSRSRTRPYETSFGNLQRR